MQFTIYRQKYKKIMIDYERLYMSTWGPIYWNFIHSVSILIQHAYYENKLTDILQFPSVVHNLDTILPCSICEGHYLKIINSQRVLELVKNMEFGLIVASVFHFHNEITKNIARHSTNVYKEYNTINFVFEYGCYPRSKPTQFVQTQRMKIPVKFYRPEHVKLSILVMMSYEINYFHASNIFTVICERILNSNHLVKNVNVEAYKVDETTTNRNQVNVFIW